jgi:translation initiation factor 2 alpha subunit (eIF-2alpha)
MAVREIEEGAILLCNVKKIVGTTVFVDIEGYGKEGTIITSEIAPGRIRNLRDYVVPNKKIVCKVIKVSGDNINLSLRRVNAKERKDLLEEFEKEKKAITIMKMAYGEGYEGILDGIIEKYDKLYLFFQKKDENEIIKLFGKERGEKIIEILKKVKEKRIEIRKRIKIQLKEGNIENLKKIFNSLPIGFSVKYISAPDYEIIFTGKEYKEANKMMDMFLSKVKESARKENILIED